MIVCLCFSTRLNGKTWDFSVSYYIVILHPLLSPCSDSAQHRWSLCQSCWNHPAVLNYHLQSNNLILALIMEIYLLSLKPCLFSIIHLVTVRVGTSIASIITVIAQQSKRRFSKPRFSIPVPYLTWYFIFQVSKCQTTKNVIFSFTLQ